MRAISSHETDIHDLNPVGEELTDDELAQVAGGLRVIDIKSYDEDGTYVDHEIYIVD